MDLQNAARSSKAGDERDNSIFALSTNFQKVGWILNLCLGMLKDMPRHLEENLMNNHSNRQTNAVLVLYVCVLSPQGTESIDR